MLLTPRDLKKIHLDCSMSCADDPIPLTDEIVASRAARLAVVIAENTAKRHYLVLVILFMLLAQKSPFLKVVLLKSLIPLR